MYAGYFWLNLSGFAYIFATCKGLFMELNFVVCSDDNQQPKHTLSSHKIFYMTVSVDARTLNFRVAIAMCNIKP